MRKIILTKGLPGSGKTTWAKEMQKENPNLVLVNKDELRAMLHSSVHSKGRESFVLAVRDFIVIKSLQEGHDVIVHDTNFHQKHIDQMVVLANSFPPDKKVQVEVKDFTDVPVDECIRRDKLRTNSVGAGVIRKMYEENLMPSPPVVPHYPKKPYAVICDLDGTLALFGKNNPYDRDFSQDKANTAITVTLKAVKHFSKAKVIIVSGRKDIFKEVTEKWLKDNGVEYDAIYMRKGEDVRKDVVVKGEIFQEFIEGEYNIDFVLDDRNQVVDFWRSKGLTCFQVAPGDF